MAIAIGLAIAGAVTAAGAIAQANIAKQQGEVQKKIAEYNAAQLEEEKQTAIDAAHLEESRAARKARLFKGEQIARAGASGLSIEEGSTTDVLADITEQTSLDRQLILRQGLIAGRQRQGQADVERLQGQWAQMYGRKSAQIGYLSAAGSGISTVGNIWGTMNPHFGG